GCSIRRRVGSPGSSSAGLAACAVVASAAHAAQAVAISRRLRFKVLLPPWCFAAQSGCRRDGSRACRVSVLGPGVPHWLALLPSACRGRVPLPNVLRVAADQRSVCDGCHTANTSLKARDSPATCSWGTKEFADG